MILTIGSIGTIIRVDHIIIPLRIYFGVCLLGIVTTEQFLIPVETHFLALVFDCQEPQHIVTILWACAKLSSSSGRGPNKNHRTTFPAYCWMRSNDEARGSSNRVRHEPLPIRLGRWPH
jgi:hypothetical protein